MEKELYGDKALEKIRELIKDIDIGMLTTYGIDGGLHSRPMSSNRDVQGDGTTWFFTRRNSRLVDEIKENTEVHLTFNNTAKHIYVSVLGEAVLIEDKALMKEHWKPELSTWFKEGLKDPELLLIRVTMKEGEYWEVQDHFLAHTLNFARSIAGKDPSDMTEHGVAKPH